jgi:tight adherence protein B
VKTHPLRTAVRVLAAAVIVGVGVAGSATGAGADVGSGDLYINQFDGGGPSAGGRNSIEVTWSGQPAQPRIEVSENGQPVKLESGVTRLTRDRGIVFVIDSGKGMDHGNVLPQVRDTIMTQARAFPDLEYAVVQAGDRADVRTEFTREPARLQSALAAVGPTSGSSVWQSVKVAAAMFDDRTRLQPNIVLVTADDDTVSPLAGAVARSAVLANGTQVQTVAYGGPSSQLTDPEPYNQLEAIYGATVELQPDREQLLAELRSAVSNVAERQYRVSWVSTAPAGQPLRVEVTVGDHHDAIDVLAGRGIYRGYQQLHPELSSSRFSLPLIDSPLIFGLGLVLVLVGVAGAAYAITTSLVKDNLSNVLQPYSDAYKMMEGDTEDEGNGSAMVAKSALLQKAVAFTEQVAEQQGLLTRAEGALERANLPLRAGEALFAYVVIVVAATLVPLVLMRNVVPAIICGVLGAMLPLVTVSQIATRRRKSFLGQLPDTLSLLSGTLKAGYSLMQGVESVSKEVSEPMGLELRRVVTESRLGRPLEESLEASADRMDSPDFAWAVMAIRIQREVGGNLAELLMTVSDTMVARERLRRDVASLTAEGRVSAYMLAAMPPCLAGVMYVLNKEYVTTLFTDGLGIAMVILASISMVVGFLWMRKIITIEI